MIACQNCGKLNAGESNFCRFCGTKFTVRQPMPENPYDYSAPRPYAWKTDEFQTQAEPRPTERANVPTQPFNPSNYQPAPLAYRPGQQAVGPFTCPRCGNRQMPLMERRVSTAGWITFSVLLVFTVIFFWVGLCMKEDVAVCPVCRWRYS